MAKGVKTGGRKKGVKNKLTAERERAIAASGLTPLEFLLSVVRDTKAKKVVRIDAARAVAPYVHPKLAAITITTPPGQPIETRDVSDEPELIGAYFRRIGAAASVAAAAAAGALPYPHTGPDSGVGKNGPEPAGSGSRKGSV
jgi:hypothetical protein